MTRLVLVFRVDSCHAMASSSRASAAVVGVRMCGLPGCFRPAFVDPETRIPHDFCGRTHARQAQESQGRELPPPHGPCHVCRLPGCEEPVYYDPTSDRVHEFCCKGHADEALHDCVLRGTTPDGAVVEVSSCRCLLAARSEYFRALFFGPMGTTDRTVNLGDIPSANALRTLVRYLASGSPGACATLVEVAELYALAHRFSLFDFASAIISCIERLDEHPEEIIAQKEFTKDEILEAASRAAELLAAGCSTAFLTALACSSQWRTIAQEESFRSFARAHPDLAAEFSGLLTKLLAKEGC